MVNDNHFIALVGHSKSVCWEASCSEDLEWLLYSSYRSHINCNNMMYHPEEVVKLSLAMSYLRERFLHAVLSPKKWVKASCESPSFPVSHCFWQWWSPLPNPWSHSWGRISTSLFSFIVCVWVLSFLMIILGDQRLKRWCVTALWEEGLPSSRTLWLKWYDWDQHCDLLPGQESLG